MSPAAATPFALPGGGGGGGSVSSVSEASAHPGSAGKSVKPSPSLSAPSEHCGEGGGSEGSTTRRVAPGWLFHVIDRSHHVSLAARRISAPAAHLLPEFAKTPSVARTTVSPGGSEGT